MESGSRPICPGLSGFVRVRRSDFWIHFLIYQSHDKSSQPGHRQSSVFVRVAGAGRQEPRRRGYSPPPTEGIAPAGKRVEHIHRTEVAGVPQLVALGEVTEDRVVEISVAVGERPARAQRLFSRQMTNPWGGENRRIQSRRGLADTPFRDFVKKVATRFPFLSMFCERTHARRRGRLAPASPAPLMIVSVGGAMNRAGPASGRGSEPHRVTVAQEGLRERLASIRGLTKKVRTSHEYPITGPR